MSTSFDGHFRRISDAGEPLVLAEEATTLVTEHGSTDCTATVSMRLRPQLRLVIEATVAEARAEHVKLLLDSGEVTLEFPHRSLSVNAYVGGGSFGSKVRLMAHPRTEPLSLRPKGGIHKVGFHLLNFPDFHTREDGKVWNNWVQMKAEDVTITIAPAGELAGPQITGQPFDVYRLTHVGWMERAGEGRLSLKQVTDWTLMLLHYLSLAKGGWSGPFLPFGVNRKGDVVWEEWGARSTDSKQHRMSWLPHEGGHLLRDAFPGFVSCWRDPSLQLAFQKALYWYLLSNSQAARLDGGVVLTQAALELLAWTYLVDVKRGLSPEGFEKLSAADQIRLLLSTLKIPTSVPDAAVELARYAKSRDLDGPAAFTQYRNRTVHPGRLHSRSRKSNDTPPVFDLWNLGLWYVEMTVLRLCGYNGEYRSRFHPYAAGPQLVPWATDHRSGV